MKTLIKLTLFIIVAQAISGCAPLSGVPCENPQLQIELRGFDSSDLSGLMVATFRKDGTFTYQEKVQNYSLKATGKTDTIQISAIGQTVIIPSYADPNYDYLVTLPVLSRVYKIASITFGHGHTPDTNHGCINSSSWFVNGDYTQVNQYNRGVSTPCSNILISK